MLIHRKLRKFLNRPRLTPKGEKSITPFIITDSKGYKLEAQTRTETEKGINLFCGRGAILSECRRWLEQSIEILVQNESNIWFYMWAGTCDFTSKNNQYISLRAQDDSVTDDILNEIQLVVQCIINHPGCKITILEIPLYSIVAWNTKAKHSDIQQFYEQDSDLEKQIIKVNRRIREINEQNNSYSPKFSSDLTLIQKCRKGKKHQPVRRVQHIFELYYDGIHSRPLLSKVWLKNK